MVTLKLRDKHINEDIGTIIMNFIPDEKSSRKVRIYGFRQSLKDWEDRIFERTETKYYTKFGTYIIEIGWRIYERLGSSYLIREDDYNYNVLEREYREYDIVGQRIKKLDRILCTKTEQE